MYTFIPIYHLLSSLVVYFSCAKCSLWSTGVRGLAVASSETARCLEFLKSRLDIAACTSMMFYGVLYIDIVIYINTNLLIIRLMYQKRSAVYLHKDVYIYISGCSLSW